MKTCLEGIETLRVALAANKAYVGMKTCLEGIETQQHKHIC